MIEGGGAGATGGTADGRKQMAGDEDEDGMESWSEEVRNSPRMKDFQGFRPEETEMPRTTVFRKCLMLENTVHELTVRVVSLERENCDLRKSCGSYAEKVKDCVRTVSVNTQNIN